MKTNIKQQTLNELEISSNKCQMKPSIMRFIRDSIFKWENQAIQYPEKGSDLVYFKGVHPRGVTVHCLLYYGHDNFLEGILNYYPIDLLPWQKRGSVNILVRPDRRRNRIASSLLDEAIKRWNIKLEKQVYTKDGESFICKYISTSSIYKSYRKRF
jgi:hypothetical protein